MKRGNNVVPVIYNVVPARNNVVKPKDNVVPAIYNVVPARNNVVKSFYNIVKKRSDMVKRRKNVVLPLKPLLLTGNGQKETVEGLGTAIERNIATLGILIDIRAQNSAFIIPPSDIFMVFVSS